MPLSQKLYSNIPTENVKTLFFAQTAGPRHASFQLYGGNPIKRVHYRDTMKDSTLDTLNSSYQRHSYKLQREKEEQLAGMMLATAVASGHSTGPPSKFKTGIMKNHKM